MNLTLHDFCNAGRFDGEFDALAALLIEHRPMMERYAAAPEEERQATMDPATVASMLREMRARADAVTRQKVAMRCLEFGFKGAHRLALDGYIQEHATAYATVFATLEAEILAGQLH